MLFIYLSMMDDDAQRSKFEYIYHTYYGMMYKIACEFTKDPLLAEEYRSRGIPFYPPGDIKEQGREQNQGKDR